MVSAMPTKVGRAGVFAKAGRFWATLILKTYVHNNASPTGQSNLYELKANSVFLLPGKIAVFSLKAPNFGRGNPLLESD